MRAQAARKMQNIIGRPPLRKFIEIIKFQLLPNCTTTIQDTLNAEMIFGPNVGSLKGETPWSTPSSALIQNIDIPADILDLYQNVIISGDIMFINKVPFFVTISHKIKFSTAEALPNRKQHLRKTWFHCDFLHDGRRIRVPASGFQSYFHQPEHYSQRRTQSCDQEIHLDIERCR